MFFSRPAGHKFVTREDPAVPDFTLADFPNEDIYYDLDLSAIVPVGTVGVVIAYYGSNSVVGGTVYFKKKGFVNVIDGNAFTLNVAGRYVRGNLIIPCGAERIIQGLKSNTTWDLIDLTITGWWV